MFGLLKKCMKTGVVATLLVGGAAAAAVAIAGPHRTKAVVHSFHEGVLSKIDASIEDPVALRSQLQEMEREYPKRIAEVRADLAELDEEIRQLDREQTISNRVVELAEADLSELRDTVAQAAATTEAGSRGLRVVVDDRVLSLERATSRIQQIENTRVAYANRSADARHDLEYLVQQRGRLDELLVQLESERSQFRAQIDALSRQVDAIARNERLITLLEKRNRTIERCSRYEAVSLEQITGKLASIRSRQEAELDILSESREEGSYEDLARMQLATEASADVGASGISEGNNGRVHVLSPYVAGEGR